MANRVPDQQVWGSKGDRRSQAFLLKEIHMNGDRNRTGHDRGIRNLAIASICLPFLVFPLGPVAIVLNEIIGPSTSLLGLLPVLGIVLPAAGGVCGHIALKRIGARSTGGCGKVQATGQGRDRSRLWILGCLGFDIREHLVFHPAPRIQHSLNVIGGHFRPAGYPKNRNPTRNP